VAIFKLWSFLDSRARSQNSSSLAEKCALASGNIAVLLIVPTDRTVEAANVLCTLLQNASCPKAFKVTIVESVEAYETESRLLKLYKERTQVIGRYQFDFLDLVDVHQVFSKTPFIEALELFQSQRKLVLVVEVASAVEFVVNWDISLEKVYDEVHGPSFGGLYCGSSAIHDVIRPSFTTNTSGTIESWPLWRSGPPVEVMWPASPILMETMTFKKLQRFDSFQDAILKTDRQFWTTREPVAMTSKELGFSKTSTIVQKSLGLSSAPTHLEIIMKYGSVSAFKWAGGNVLI